MAGSLGRKFVYAHVGEGVKQQQAKRGLELLTLSRVVHLKHLDLAVRCDANPPSALEVEVKTTRGDPVRYRLLSVPPYLLHHLPVLLTE